MTAMFEPLRQAIVEAAPGAEVTALAVVWLGGETPALNFLVCAEEPHELRALARLLRDQADALFATAELKAFRSYENEIGPDGVPLPLILPRESPLA